MSLSLKVASKIDDESMQQFSLAGGKDLDVSAVDISIFGIGLLSKHFFPQGLIIELQIEGGPFGLRKDIKVKGEIRYCRYIKQASYKCGVKFLKISPRDQKAIGKFVSQYERREAPRLKFSE